MTFGIKILLLLILPFLIRAKDEFEYHRWPTVQSVNALIKRYEGELRFVQSRFLIYFLVWIIGYDSVFSPEDMLHQRRKQMRYLAMLI